MLARCSFCDKLITAENQGQFFPEDDSYICVVCRKEHQRSLEKIGNYSHRNLSAIRQGPVERNGLIDPAQAGEVRACVIKSL